MTDKFNKVFPLGKYEFLKIQPLRKEKILKL
jgi:hypothetical protein